MIAPRLLTALLLFASLSAAAQAPLVILSIDGMKPEYVTHADEHHLKIPNLRTYLTHGTYAEGVVGVVPTLTYPSHTTLLTGVWPAEHGIYGNTLFDPLNQHPGAWYWDFSSIKVETLYQAASQAGIKTAAVGWPVTVGAPIDYNIADFTQSEKTAKPSAPLYHPLNLLAQLHATPASNDEDDIKTAQSVAILRRFHPGLLLVHLTDLDHQEHEHQPFSPQADATLEKIDTQVAAIEQAALAANPATSIAIVSDHGFLPVEHLINLNALFVQAGLITLGPKNRVVSWRAAAWACGGSAAILLHDPPTRETVQTLADLLQKAQANPDYGIRQILSQDDLAEHGGFPQASFLVDFRDGFESGPSYTNAIREEVPGKGMHGYLPTRPGMLSAFMIKGQGIATARDLQVIDMRRIAPTFAQLLGVALPAAKQPPVNLKP